MNVMTREENKTNIQLELVREFDASPEEVFKAWTDPIALQAWMAPEGMTCPDAEANAFVEGSYKFPMVSSNGEVDTAVGHYTCVEAPYKLAFSWSWLQEDGTVGHPMHVTLEFERLPDNRTRMNMLHINLADQELKERHNSGWESCFNCLDSYLAS
ncbi:SRPBCC family protein [Sneathiella sp.]|jgi:uncharacterized protein YndB with AHSA1/START domain|uniref:SRPBCC family protein n=1 Tax=Sneathiella sp. TaxID=1964365 RepID=UPI0039E34D9A